MLELASKMDLIQQIEDLKDQVERINHLYDKTLSKIHALEEIAKLASLLVIAQQPLTEEVQQLLMKYSDYFDKKSKEIKQCLS